MDLKQELSSTTLGEIRNALRPAEEALLSALEDGEISESERDEILAEVFHLALRVAVIYVQSTEGTSDDLILGAVSRMLESKTDT